MISVRKISKKTMTDEKRKNARNDYFAYYIGRPISYLFTIPFLYTNIKPNTITIWSMLFIIVGTVSTSLPYNKWLLIIGWFFFFLWNIFDGIDGNVARYKEIFSKNGSTFDATAGYLAMYFTYFAYGIAAFNYEGYLLNFNIPSIVYVILGSISGFSLIFPRLILHKKKSSVNDRCEEVNNLQDKSSYGFVRKIALNLTSISGFVQVFMLIICILTMLDIYLFDIFTIVYFFINVLLMFVSLFKLLKE